MEANDRTSSESIQGRKGVPHDPAVEGLLRFRDGKSVPVVLQTEAAECGLACVAMLAGYHGHSSDLLALRSRFPGSLRGAKLQELMDIASALGLTSRPVQVGLEHLHQLHAPCILHWDMNHFVVLAKVKADRLEIIDPARGRRKLTLAEAGKHFTGVAMEVDAGPRLEKKEDRTSISIRALAGHVTGLWKALLQVLCLALLLEGLGLLAPQFLQIVVDQVLANGDGQLLAMLGVGFTVMLLIRILVETLRAWTLMWISTNLSISWNGNLFSHLVKLPIDYFLKRHLSDVASRFGSISAIQQTLTASAVVGILDGMMALVTAGMMFVYSGWLASVTIAFAMLYGALRAVYFRALREASEKQINLSAAQAGVLLESLRAMPTIRLYNGSAQRVAKYMNSAAATLNAGISIQKLNLAFSGINGFTAGAQRIAVLWIGAWLALRGQLTAGMLMAFVAYAEQFTARFASLAEYLVQLRLLKLHGERLADIALTAPEPHLEGTYVGLLRSHTISFHGVTYSYSPNGPEVLKDCSFDVADGEIVAITGPSGCGKSTIARVLLGMVERSGGVVSIGGVDTLALGKRRVRSLISSVLQDDKLMSGTILENITMFDPASDLERAQLAAERANVAHEIEAMPMGYHTGIGDMGSSLSGGQSQRLLLARALYREPKILVLDEATSHLDLDNERAICRAVRNAGITTLLIAHRPQTIESADRVLVMDHGSLGASRCRGDRDAINFQAVI